MFCNKIVFESVIMNLKKGLNRVNELLIKQIRKDFSLKTYNTWRQVDEF